MGSKSGFCHGMYEEAIIYEAMEPMIQAILLVESFKNWSPRPLDERVQDQKKSGKLRQNLHSTCFGGKNQSVWTPKKKQSNSRIQFASIQSKLVPRKLDHGPSSQRGPKGTWYWYKVAITLGLTGLVGSLTLEFGSVCNFEPTNRSWYYWGSRLMIFAWY
jgi:hypothetical protein